MPWRTSNSFPWSMLKVIAPTQSRGKSQRQGRSTKATRHPKIATQIYSTLNWSSRDRYRPRFRRRILETRAKAMICSTCTSHHETSSIFSKQEVVAITAKVLWSKDHSSSTLERRCKGVVRVLLWSIAIWLRLEIPHKQIISRTSFASASNLS